MPKKVAASRSRARATPVRPPPKLPTPKKAAFPIVGIGASAGGFEAFLQLLKALHPNSGMAFLFVMHLEPDHKSLLAGLFSNVTKMSVTEARNGTEVEPNHVYVIPPKADMSIRVGVIHIAARKKTGTRHLPVDYLLSSLAEDQGGRAIGIILSGTASDGTVGLKAIKAGGGITFAQDEESSKFYGMPGSAISAGCVDFVLPPDRIGKELERLARHPHIGMAQFAKPAELPATGESEFQRILYLLRSSNGVDFTHYKPATIHRRIERRMVLQKIQSPHEYVNFLRSNRAELDGLFNDILINVTSFFREPEVFKTLRSRLFPKIVAGKKRREAIRVWVPGCSSGEEVYSLAIALLEFLGDRASGVPIQVFGTDISEPALDTARNGTYPESSLRDISPVRLHRFFTKVEGGYRVQKTLRDMCIFARQDLTKDPPFSRIDLISCRNVLIYLGTVLQKRILAAFHYALLNGGYLLLGNSEANTNSDLFAPADPKIRVYSKKAGRAKFAPDFSPASFDSAPMLLTPPDAPAFDALKEADRVVWQRFAHAGLVLNDQLEILHFRGDTSPYLAPASGKASLYALRMVKDELKVELRLAIQKARRTSAPVRIAGLRIEHNGGNREVNLEVDALIQPGGKDRYFLVLFDESPLTVPAEPKPSAARLSRYTEDREVAQLRRQLEASREYLHGIVEQQETVNEELKASNEEILSSNEELQSTNEELETAKEELQSTNEELVTLNETLHNRNAELAQLTDDLNNVLVGANIPILIIGDTGRIRRFTPSAEGLLNLLSSDVGRPIENIRPNIEMPDSKTLRQVSRTLVELQREVQSKEGHWYSLRIRPYRTADNKIDGVVMAFFDIDGLKRANDALRQIEVQAARTEKEGALRLSQQELQTLTASLLTAQEEERGRLAGELHDDLNQRLAALALKAGALEQRLPDSTRGVRDEVHGFRVMAQELSDDVRHLAHQLHPSALKHFGLATALRSYCEEFSKLHDLHIHFRQRNVPKAIPEDAALCLYRVTQEALANAAKHSGAKEASVTLAGAAGGIHLAVSDDGEGFDRAAASSQPGLGLGGMGVRVRLAGGTLSVKTRLGEGCRIEARIPLNGEPA